jgi:hypothetical protein
VTDSRTALERALAGRYAVERELGRGGIATGWLEVDPTLDPLRRHPRFRKLVGGAP